MQNWAFLRPECLQNAASLHTCTTKGEGVQKCLPQKTTYTCAYRVTQTHVAEIPNSQISQHGAARKPGVKKDCDVAGSRNKTRPHGACTSERSVLQGALQKNIVVLVVSAQTQALQVLDSHFRYRAGPNYRFSKQFHISK